ncbi:MAG: hybrid sensor histidine kinase/response regulator [Bacteroidaceae bacterium]
MDIEIKKSEYKILIVDDVSSNILLLKILLLKEHFQVITATSGEEAMEKTRTEKPDLLLLDVMMPGMTGYEVAEKLKSEAETKEIPIIFLTALNNATDVVKGFQMGGNDFISKPFNKDELIIRVTHQISLVAARRIIIRQTEELRKVIIGRDKLYSVIAHDLRSPMGAIKMVLNMLSASLPPTSIGDDMFEMLEQANQMTEETFSLLDNLLKWTKSQTGRLNVVWQNFNILEVVLGVTSVFSMVAKTKGIKIVTCLPTDPINVYADIDMIKTIVRNYLSNAIKFSNEGSRVIIKVVNEKNKAIVSVQDFGQGISEDAQSKMFQVDTHFSTFGTNKEEGSGLGLLLCQDFIIKNNGNLWLESKEGVGSTFSFSIPLKEQDL